MIFIAQLVFLNVLLQLFSQLRISVLLGINSAFFILSGTALFDLVDLPAEVVGEVQPDRRGFLPVLPNLPECQRLL